MSARRSAAGVLAAIALAWTMAAEAQAPAPEPDQSVDPPIESLLPLEQPPPKAAPQPALPGAPASTWQPRAVAQLSALDKIGDRSATLNVPVGSAMSFEHLTISVQACVARGSDAAAFLQIADAQSNPQVDGAGFRGWMLAAEPSVAMLQNPVYDLRVVACH